MEAITTITNSKEFMKSKAELGWVITDIIRWDEEPRFDTEGVWMDNVNVIDYHFEDAEGTPMGSLQVVVGEELTEASWMDFNWDF
jgi:hypothetical protein